MTAPKSNPAPLAELRKLPRADRLLEAADRAGLVARLGHGPVMDAIRDEIERGRFFDVSRLRGETTLVKMHRDFKVDGNNKRAAYEIAVDDGDAREKGIIYIAQHLDFEGVRFFCLKEGYSVLLVMNDKDGREIYGAHVPLQSLKQANGSYLYATGTAKGAGSFAFPPPPERPRAELQMSYRPNIVVERAGEVSFWVQPLAAPAVPVAERKGQVLVGGRFDAGDFTVSPREIRYWVGMNVRYDPGLNVVMGSLCLALGGMVMTLVGRVRQGAGRRRAAQVN